MKPAPFEYAPPTADEAVQLIGELGDGAKVLAGGQSLIPMLALRLGPALTLAGPFAWWSW
jgi:carbon-monoxide dehydrogenase medium subunit